MNAFNAPRLGRTSSAVICRNFLGFVLDSSRSYAKLVLLRVLVDGRVSFRHPPPGRFGRRRSVRFGFVDGARVACPELRGNGGVVRVFVARKRPGFLHPRCGWSRRLG